MRDPAMVLHCHVTPSDWSKYVGESEAAGGSYNRILPFLLGSVPLLDDDRVSLPDVDGRDLSDAYGWATARPRVITLAEDARPLWRVVRRYARILGETLPEGQAVFIERTAEQTLRVAACLAASECSEAITEEILSAAFSLVRRSVQDAVRITKGATSPKVKRQPLSLEDKVRARIKMHGGRATSTQVLPYVGERPQQRSRICLESSSLWSGRGRPADRPPFSRSAVTVLVTLCRSRPAQRVIGTGTLPVTQRCGRKRGV
ncbi:hypothetical protein AB0O67_07825 [Streptomyces sp. NPDC086077]|uniref:hypothetical protein n=1 Tax=Streptomyces sp. NPDC086077 TaxID=3154862 RepID=UPI00341A1031